MLTDAQIADYREKGYVVPDYRLAGEVLEDIREGIPSSSPATRSIRSSATTARRS